MVKHPPMVEFAVWAVPGLNGEDRALLAYFEAHDELSLTLAEATTFVRHFQGKLQPHSRIDVTRPDGASLFDALPLAREFTQQ